jgi:uncharacterized membrane protein YhaH (DUF805 family)
VAALLSLATPTEGVELALLIVSGLAVIVPDIAVLVRRRHGGGRSGADCFVSCISLVGGMFLLVLLVHSGTSDPSRHGPAPTRSGRR